MFAAFVIVFREVIEAGLVIGIVLAATRSIAGRTRWIVAGTLGGVAGACLVALLAGQIAAAFSGIGQEMFNATVLGIAVVMLTWHNVWMARHGRELATHFHHLGADVRNGNRSLLALSIVVGLAVLREGAEVVLFLYGVTVSAPGAAPLIGGFAGLGLGALLSGATYLGLLRIPGRYLFGATSLLIALLASGMAATAVGFLHQADVIRGFDTIVWDSSAFLPQNSLLGKSLNALIGYSDQPTLMQLLAYGVTLAMILILMRVFAPKPPATAHHS